MPRHAEDEEGGHRRHHHHYRRRTSLSSSPESEPRERRKEQSRRDRSSHDDRRPTHRESPRERSESPRGSNGRRERRDDVYSSKRKRSPRRSPRRSRSERSQSPIPHKRSNAPLPSQEQSYRGTDNTLQASDKPPEVEKQKPNFSNTGKLAAETNTVAGIVLKYNEPPEARKPPPKDAWRLYVFKGSEMLENVELSERSCWLVGRERVVVDFPVDHPSCSKQHAVVQFRHVVKTNEFGDKDACVRPYIIDLESANGTMVNGEKIPPTRYVELRDKDMIQFGLSTREYVLMLPP
ncbi:MAG: hypothetical protein M1835_001099 [Candelina submexicana]|nr:MAG: hypothetical protein M1835_001099 [Candelina submexicana]